MEKMRTTAADQREATGQVSGLTVIISSLVIYVTAKLFYNLYLHPLARYPGPFLARASWVWRSYWSFHGRLPLAVRDLHTKYGDVVRVGPDVLYFATGQAFEDIFGRTAGNAYAFDKFPGREVRLPGAPASITFAQEVDHRRYRRVLSPAFSEKAVLEQEDIMNSHIQALIRDLKQQVTSTKKNAIDVEKSISAMMFDTTMDLAFGKSINSTDSESKVHPVHESIKRSIAFVAKYCGIRETLPSPVGRLMDHALLRLSAKSKAQAHAYSSELVLARIKSPTDRRDWMAHMTQSHDKPGGMNLEEIRRMGYTLIAAGGETVATLLCSALCLLDKNRHCLQALHRELEDVFGNDPESVTMQTAKRALYLTAVLEETLRMCPPVPFTFERVAPDAGATVCGTRVPGGTVVSVSQLAINYDERNFHRPAEFLPQRWMGSPQFESDDRKSRKPFSHGSRACLGQTMTYAYSRVALARILLEFDFSLSKDSQNWFETCRMFDTIEKQPLLMHIVPRIS